MKILEIKSLALPEIKVVRFGRFHDERGFFSETFRSSDFTAANGLGFLEGETFVQFNESFSRTGVVRGLHFQWQPPMGKLVRTLYGRMVDLALDIRPGSPRMGKIIAYEMPGAEDRDYDEWIWVPPGFAHGNFFSAPTRIEYLCTAVYNPSCESGVNPLDRELDWSLCDKTLAGEYLDLIGGEPVISAKDREACSLAEWMERPEAKTFSC
ncbi:MAG: dTDP-4-keto-6-deoxy-D-glucose epimerase [Candidatus Glassbacteria bacterium]|nr:dTDP-4-keto-6-deoxy-D-glucose epimerase [Candidatus Glassbacteria bacterium]